jgi:two-component system chemotaxis sensor kinase CheA
MNVDESMLDVYIYETQQLLESLENTLFEGEGQKALSSDHINEIFRIMHTIKGASSMMEFEQLAKLAHALEDMFSQIREKGVPDGNWQGIFDVTFNAVSFFNGELAKLQDKKSTDGDATEILGMVRQQLERLKNGSPASAKMAGEDPLPDNGGKNLENAEPSAPVAGPDEPYYKLKLFFEEGCQMENIRALGVIESIKKYCSRIAHVPESLDSDSASTVIIQNGFCVYLQTRENPDVIKNAIETTLFMKSYSILPIEGDDEEVPASIRRAAGHGEGAKRGESPESGALDGFSGELIAKQNFISVNVNKLDHLLNVVGEIVTAQSMVINNANFGDADRSGFDAAAQQLHSLINELQDVVMSIRMMPMSTLFQKMRRLVRDMAKKLGKDVQLEISGEETEVDKNVIDHLSDPLLHTIRNSVDHGIEDEAARIAAGKPPRGTISLEAHTTGSDVIVTIFDDGRGLQKEAILKKAQEKGLLTKSPEEMTDREIFSMIFLPGFSTSSTVTEYSGRGVGMDVVRKNISQIGGSISLESEEGTGTTHIIRIPLTLTIVDGMRFSVGKTSFIVPTVSVLSAVKPDPKDIITDPEGNEMIMLQGNCYSLVRLKDFFHIEDGITDISEGMCMHITSEEKDFVIFFDHLDGEYQVVVKPLPSYLQQCTSSLDGLGGCAILGDGSINLILDVNGI